MQLVPLILCVCVNFLPVGPAQVRAWRQQVSDPGYTIIIPPRNNSIYIYYRSFSNVGHLLTWTVSR